MRYRTRLRLLAAPLVAALFSHAPRSIAQANTNSPTSGPSKEGTGEVQVGAGTQGDVTTGSSGPQNRKAKPSVEQGHQPSSEANRSTSGGTRGQQGQGQTKSRSNAAAAGSNNAQRGG